MREQEGRGRREEPVSAGPVRVGKGDGWKEGSKRREALSRPLEEEEEEDGEGDGIGKRGGWDECEEGGRRMGGGEEILGKFEREAKEGIRRI